MRTVAKLSRFESLSAFLIAPDGLIGSLRGRLKPLQPAAGRASARCYATAMMRVFAVLEEIAGPSWHFGKSRTST
jgi:hypothetical protein